MEDEAIKVKIEPNENMLMKDSDSFQSDYRVPILIDPDVTIQQEFEVKPSTIAGAGNGVFACIDIPKDKNIGKYCPNATRVKMPRPGECSVAHYGVKMRIIGRKERYLVDGMNLDGQVTHWTALINHSFAPNVVIWDDGVILVNRDIKKGEELFVDYGLPYWYGACPELRPFQPVYVQALLTHKRTREQNRLVVELQMKMNERYQTFHAIEQMWAKLHNRIQKEIEDRQSLSPEERLILSQKNKLYHKSLPEPKTFEDMVVLQKAKRKRENKRFNKYKKRKPKNVEKSCSPQKKKIQSAMVETLDVPNHGVIELHYSTSEPEDVETQFDLKDLKHFGVEAQNIAPSLVNATESQKKANDILDVIELFMLEETKKLDVIDPDETEVNDSAAENETKENDSKTKRNILIEENVLNQAKSDDLKSDDDSNDDKNDDSTDDKNDDPNDDKNDDSTESETDTNTVVQQGTKTQVPKKGCTCVLVDNLNIWNTQWKTPFAEYMKRIGKPKTPPSQTTYLSQVTKCFQHGFAIEEFKDVEKLRAKMNISCCDDRSVLGGQRGAGLAAFGRFLAQYRK